MKKKDENKLIENILLKCGEEENNSIIKNMENLLQLDLHAKSIITDLEFLKEVYLENIFDLAKQKYNEKLENSSLFKKLECLKSKNLNNKHNLTDEISLLFYVGLYHKIENYESEILQDFNSVNKTNFKDISKIDIDAQKNKKIFKTRNRLRLISNSIKHNHFYPKNELLEYYPYFRTDTKITLNDFNPDVDFRLVKSYILLLNSLIIIKSIIFSIDKTHKNEAFKLELQELFSKLLEFENPEENEIDILKFIYINY